MFKLKELSEMPEDETEAYVQVIELSLDGSEFVVTKEDMELYEQIIKERTA